MVLKYAQCQAVSLKTYSLKKDYKLVKEDHDQEILEWDPHAMEITCLCDFTK
jgi:hypothetical protein